MLKLPILSLNKINITSDLAKDVFWTLFGQFTIMLCMLILNKVLSNTLSIEEFGQYNVIKRSSSVLSVILLGGLGIAIPRFLPINISKQRVRETRGIIYVSIIYLLLIDIIIFSIYIILKPILSDFVIGSNDIFLYILVFFYSLFISFASYLSAYYRGISKFRSFNISQIIFQISVLLTLFAPANSIKDYLFYWTIAHLICLIIYVLKEVKSYKKLFFLKVYFHELIRTAKEITIYSLPRLLGDFFLIAYSSFPILYIGKTSGLTNVSVFSVGLTLFNLTNGVFAFLGIIILPLVSKMFAKNKINEADRKITKLLLLYLLIAFLLFILLYTFMPMIIKLFYSQEYLGAVSISRILCISIIPSTLYYLYRNPNDAVSSVPFNTIILAISFLILVYGFIKCNTLESYAFVFLLVSSFQGLGTMFVWKLLIKHIN